MKTSSSLRKQYRNLVKSGALIVGTCVAGRGVVIAQQASAPAKASEPVKATEKAEAEDTAELNNWVEFGLGGNFLNGSKAQYQRQNGVPSGVYGGIESFHYEQEVGKKGLFSIDGRGLFDNHDYSIKLELSNPDKGYIRFGYDQFRDYYDGSAGYLPSNGLFFVPNDPVLAVDRGSIYVEAGLTLPEVPEVTFRYEHQTREGTKDSTIWGTTTLTPGAAQKKITPSWLTLDERRDIFSLDVRHLIQKTEVGIGGRADIQSNDDTRNTYQQPNQGTTSRVLSHREGVDADMYNAHAFTDTRISDRWQFTTGYSFTTLHSVLSGERTNIPLGATMTGTDTRFTNLAGGSELKQYVLNLNLMYTPSDNWQIVPSLRVEKEDRLGEATDNAITGTATQVVSPITVGSSSDRGALFVTEGLDIRYKGVTNWVFYVRGEVSQDQAGLNEAFRTNVLTAPNLFRDTEWDRDLQKYSVGANWYPLKSVNFAAQYYHKRSDNEYTHDPDSTSNIPPADPTRGSDRYPAFFEAQEFNIDDVNFRVTWRVLPNLTFVSRYDFQLSTVTTKPYEVAEMESGNTKRHIFGETLSWTPVNRLYLQLGGNYVVDRTHTPVEEMSGVMSGVMLASPSDYWTVTTAVGYALDAKTDLQANYSHYRASNFEDNSAVGMPYGAGAKQNMVGASLSRQLSKSVRWNLRYAFSSYRDQTYGGQWNYDAHGILSTLQYRF